MTQKEEELDYLNQPESFMDVARACVRKKNKGPFDLLATICYRLNQLVIFFPKLRPTASNKDKLLALITKGLKYKNFKEFREELAQFQCLSYLNEMESIKDFYNYLLTAANEQKVTFEKMFLIEFYSVIQENFYALDFLKKHVAHMVAEEEEKLVELQKSK
ncbi:MAG: hypothetical protein PHV30_06175 [Candidatus Margulisbacteria bacterium]|nr:hypothetical protein [Candidatus Margulisiibacteriota bacterium]